MDLRINRAEIVEAVGDWADQRLRAGYEVTGITLDKNGQGATVSTTYLPTLASVDGVLVDDDGVPVDTTKLDTKKKK